MRAFSFEAQLEHGDGDDYIKRVEYDARRQIGEAIFDELSQSQHGLAMRLIRDVRPAIKCDYNQYPVHDLGTIRYSAEVREVDRITEHRIYAPIPKSEIRYTPARRMVKELFVRAYYPFSARASDDTRRRWRSG